MPPHVHVVSSRTCADAQTLDADRHADARSREVEPQGADPNTLAKIQAHFSVSQQKRAHGRLTGWRVSGEPSERREVLPPVAVSVFVSVFSVPDSLKNEKRPGTG
jgi:hypothetical protein